MVAEEAWEEPEAQGKAPVACSAATYPNLLVLLRVHLTNGERQDGQEVL